MEQIGDLIRRTDVVIELLNARLPDANHQLVALRRSKPWIKVLNKRLRIPHARQFPCRKRR